MPKPRGSKAQVAPEPEDAEPEDAETWVQCDGCNKWRRLPTSVAAALSDDTPWYCENNPLKQFASCSIPQEMTNEEIDREPSEDLSEDQYKQRTCIPAVWQLIKDNALCHRRRKVQDEDDIMICQCKPPWQGGDGCGPACINRILNIECVAGFCPCEDQCHNQMFSKRQYSGLTVKPAGAKGFGLFADEDIKAGQFIIEYIGEVLDEEEYARRKEFYAEAGQRHYYFMNIGNGEVIDACRKGNYGRFINHSCEPNCETQKWLVQGELAIGLFALRDVPAGCELTFDYNFERYGDKPMRCYCGSARCKRVIGGTQDGPVDEKLLDSLPSPDQDASGDWPPLMVTDKELTGSALRDVLDWRVGATGERDLELKVLKRLQRVCTAKGVSWRAADYYTSDGTPLPPGLRQGDDGAAAEEDGEEEADEEADDMEEDVTAQLRAVVPGLGKEGRSGKGGGERGGGGEQGGFRGPLKAAFKQMKGRRAAAGGEGGGEGGGGRTSGAAAAAESVKREVIIAQPQLDGDDAAALAAVPPRKRFSRTAPPPSSAATTTVTRVTISARDVQPPGDKPPRSASGSAVAGRRGSATSGDGNGPSSSGRSSASASLWGGPPPGWRRRSEIDRRLDELVGTSGRLKDASRPSIIRVLRMFNLCEIGPKQRAGPAAAPAGAAGATTPAPAANGNGGAAAVNATNGSEAAVATAASAAPTPLPAADGAASAPTSAAAAFPATQPPTQQQQVITARHRARMTDFSLLLDVILKTTSPAAKREFIACGVLNALLQVVARHFGREYVVLLRKVEKVLEHLPLRADDIFLARSAHGNFADALRELAQHADFEVRSKAHALLKKYPLKDCTDPALAAQAAQRPRWLPPLVGGGGCAGPSPMFGGATPAMSAAGSIGGGGEAGSMAAAMSRPMPPMMPHHAPPPGMGMGGPPGAWFGGPRGPSPDATPITSGGGPPEATPAHSSVVNSVGSYSRYDPQATPSSAYGGGPGSFPPRYGRPGPPGSVGPPPPRSSSGPVPFRPPGVPLRNGNGMAPPHHYGGGAAPPLDNPPMRHPSPGDGLAPSGSAEPPFKRMRTNSVGDLTAGGAPPPPPPIPGPPLPPGIGIAYRGGSSNGLPPRPSGGGGGPFGAPPAGRSSSGPLPPLPPPPPPLLSTTGRDMAALYESGLDGEPPSRSAGGSRREQAGAHDALENGARDAGRRLSLPSALGAEDVVQALWSASPAAAGTRCPPSSNGVSRHASRGGGSGQDEADDDEELEDGETYSPLLPQFLPPAAAAAAAAAAPYGGRSAVPLAEPSLSLMSRDTADEEEGELQGATGGGGDSRPPQQRVSGAAAYVIAPLLSGNHPAAPAESPLTPDDDGGGGAPGGLKASGVAFMDVDDGGGKGAAAAAAAAGGGSYPDAWQSPDAPGFQDFVSEVVKHRLGKYVQPDHPTRISRDDANALFKRIKREVIDAERRAHEDALSAGAGPGGLVKVIERRKLEANIKEFVRQHVRKSTLQQVASGALPNAAMNGGGN